MHKIFVYSILSFFARVNTSLWRTYFSLFSKTEILLTNTFHNLLKVCYSKIRKHSFFSNSPHYSDDWNTDMWENKNNKGFDIWDTKIRAWAELKQTIFPTFGDIMDCSVFIIHTSPENQSHIHYHKTWIQVLY